MGKLIEYLSGGLVTDRDPVLLKPGQLSAMRNLVYRNGAAGLCHAKGRIQFGVVSATATAVAGLRDINFDNGDHYLVAMAGTKYRAASLATASAGTFSDLATITAGSSLEVVQYRNRFFLMNGASSDSNSIGTNTVVYLSATATGSALTTRQHGLLPVNAAPNTVTAGGGVFSQTVTGYYEYWTTEVFKGTQDGVLSTLESAYSSDNGVSTVFISATSVVPTIQQPTLRNSLSTHWRIYRSPKKDTFADKKFPIGFMISEMGTSVSAHADTTAAASASAFPSSFSSGVFYADFASASSMAADDGVYASATVGASFTLKQQGSSGFSALSGAAGSIVGLKVELEAYVSAGAAPVPLTVSVGKRRSDGRFEQTNLVGNTDRHTFVDFAASKSGSITSTNAGAPTLLMLGGETDRWFPTNGVGLADLDFNTNFMVVLSLTKPNVSIGVDFVRVTVYYGASIDSTVQFPTVVYTFGDITSQVAKNFPPPSSNTGDLFQDQLVVNDVSNPSIIRYSFPGEPEYFPPTYFMDFETRENDNVKAVRVVNNHLMVGLNTSLHRVNYLPSERDSSFDRGKATEVVSRFYGIVNAMCCTTITVDGEAEMLVFISNKGMHTTDGFNFITRSKNQDWRKYISLTSTSTPIALLNDPENREVLFYFRNDNSQNYGTETYQCLHASYAREDIDREGNFKFSGPVNHRNSGGGQRASVESAWAVPAAGGSTDIYIGYGGSGSATAAGAGTVYYETGFNIPSFSQTLSYSTRRIYAAGVSGEWTLDDLYGYCSSADNAGDAAITYFFQRTKTNELTVAAAGTKSITLQGQKLHKVSPKFICEGLIVTATITATGHDFQKEFLVLGSKNLGAEQAGT